MDDTLDTLDTSTDIRCCPDDATDHDDALDTEQLPALDPEELDITALTSVTGGMRWEQFRQSKNVEDRRSPKAIARDQRWWDQSMGGTPLPPPRPADLGAPVPLPPRRPEGL